MSANNATCMNYNKEVLLKLVDCTSLIDNCPLGSNACKKDSRCCTLFGCEINGKSSLRLDSGKGLLQFVVNGVHCHNRKEAYKVVKQWTTF